MSGKISVNTNQQIDNAKNVIKSMVYGGSTNTDMPIFLSNQNDNDSLYTPFTDQQKSLFTNSYNSAINQGYTMSSDPIINLQNTIFAMGAENMAFLASLKGSSGQMNGNYNTNFNNANGSNQPINTVNKASALSNLYNSDGTKNEKFKELEEKEKQIRKEQDNLKREKDAKEKDVIAKRILQLQSEYEALERKYCDGKQLSEILGKNKYKFYSNLEEIELGGIKTANDQIETLKSQLEEAKKAYQEKNNEIQQKINEYAASHNGASIPTSELWNEDEKAEFDELGQRVANLEKQITKEIDILNKYIAKAAKQKEIGYHTFKIGYKPSTTGSKDTTGATETTETDEKKKVFADGKVNNDCITETFDDISADAKYQNADTEKIKEFLVSNAKNLQDNPKEFLDAVANEGTKSKLFISPSYSNATANLELLMEFYDKIHGEKAFENAVNGLEGDTEVAALKASLQEAIKRVKDAQKAENQLDPNLPGSSRKAEVKDAQKAENQLDPHLPGSPKNAEVKDDKPNKAEDDKRDKAEGVNSGKAEGGNPDKAEGGNPDKAEGVKHDKAEVIASNKFLYELAVLINRGKDNDAQTKLSGLNSNRLALILKTADPEPREEFLKSLWDDAPSKEIQKTVKDAVASLIQNEEKTVFQASNLDDKDSYIKEINNILVKNGASNNGQQISKTDEYVYKTAMKLNSNIESGDLYAIDIKEYAKFLHQASEHAVDTLIDSMYNGYQKNAGANATALIKKSLRAVGLDPNKFDISSAETIKKLIKTQIKTNKADKNYNAEVPVIPKAKETVDETTANTQISAWKDSISVGKENDESVLKDMQNFGPEKLAAYFCAANETVIKNFVESLYDGSESTDIQKFLLRAMSNEISNPSKKLKIHGETCGAHRRGRGFVNIEIITPEWSYGDLHRRNGSVDKVQNLDINTPMDEEYASPPKQPGDYYDILKYTIDTIKEQY